MKQQDLPDTLRANPWFAALEPQLFEKMVSIASQVSWSAEQVIFREGDQDDYLYFMIEGQVALEIYIPVRGRVTILTIGPDEIFGWSSAVQVIQKKTASARAVIPSRAIAFNGTALRAACEQDHNLGYHVYRRLTNVIASRLSATRMQLLDMYATGKER